MLSKIGLLSDSKLKSALDFVEYLIENEGWEANEAWKDMSEEEFISWDAVRTAV